MLKGDFFKINSMESTGNRVQALLELNPAHRIFEGHFPGQPVVPGVCMMQMIKEILETEIGRETRLLKADYLKFLSVINPLENKMIRADLQYDIGESGEISVTGSLMHDLTVYLKCKAQFVPLNQELTF